MRFSKCNMILSQYPPNLSGSINVICSDVGIPQTPKHVTDVSLGPPRDGVSFKIRAIIVF